MDFYGEVLRELLLALGAALFVANLWALLRRRTDARNAAKEAVVRGRPGSPVRRQVRVATTGNLPQAPVARTVTFMVLGLAVAIWALASLTS
ncbi:MAG TPA: hypothetical protein VFC99_16335 [Acidimicrobiia bacterium]|nr:hypothetical protein [Acidimicrobiia bacterium]